MNSKYCNGKGGRKSREETKRIGTYKKEPEFALEEELDSVIRALSVIMLARHISKIIFGDRFFTFDLFLRVSFFVEPMKLEEDMAHNDRLFSYSFLSLYAKRSMRCH